MAIICGGGSGHEPFAAGFVGNGMLSASIAGNVFAAPPPNHILHAIKCATGNGTQLFFKSQLLIIKKINNFLLSNNCQLEHW